MRVLALAFFDPASAVLSHRDLMRKAGHDFRLAVVRAYTERQQCADYVCERLVSKTDQIAPGVVRKQVHFEKLTPNLDELRNFVGSADVIQFHPGIGHGDGDWASHPIASGPDPRQELEDLLIRLGIYDDVNGNWIRCKRVMFMHGSMNAWANLDRYRRVDEGYSHLCIVAASTIDYAHELNATYLPPLVDVGDLRARLRGDDDPLLIAHTPTDRVACSTEEFLAAARHLGVPVKLGEGLPHDQVLKLKAECNAGFDHMRGAFSVNTLENAAIGLAPLFALAEQYKDRFQEELSRAHGFVNEAIRDSRSLREILDMHSRHPAYTRRMQQLARAWWVANFSAEPITNRLVKFYEGL